MQNNMVENGIIILHIPPTAHPSQLLNELTKRMSPNNLFQFPSFQTCCVSQSNPRLSMKYIYSQFLYICDIIIVHVVSYCVQN